MRWIALSFGLLVAPSLARAQEPPSAPRPQATVTTTSSPNEPLIFLGTGSLGLAYGVSAIFIGLPIAFYNAVAGTEQTRNLEYLLIPFAGPLLAHQNQPTFSRNLAWALAAPQMAGAVFLAASFVFTQRITIPSRNTTGAGSPELVVGPGSASLRVSF